jgi:hypothetical protein
VLTFPVLDLAGVTLIVLSVQAHETLSLAVPFTVLSFGKD